MNRKFNLLADMGLLPDGTPMEEELQAPQIAEMRIAATSNRPKPPKENIVEEYVSLPIDHFAKNRDYTQQGSFFNRFWVAESAYKPGGPVFLYDVGEADAKPNALFRLQNETSFFKQLVDKYNGVGIVWEHRYYGNSSPELIDVNTPPEAFKFLTTEQSLADVDKFARQFKRQNIKNDLTPDKTPWIFVGGSYPAMRAAFMRDKYPNTIFAGYASSAPTEAKIDMSSYFEPIWKGMNRYGFGNCSRDINAAINLIDRTLDRGKDAAANLKDQFLGVGGANNSNAGFADALITPLNLWQSYGIDGGYYALRLFCDWIETDPATNKIAGADGWAKSKGANFTVNRWASYPRFVQGVNYFMDTDCVGKETYKGNCNLDKKFSDPTMIAWTWQYCTQWGFFQSANLGPRQLVSKYNSLQHQKDICHRQFPTARAPLFPEWPRTDLTNKIFGGFDLRPSNVYWSGGEFDPWRTLSPLSIEPFAPKPQSFTRPPTCNDELDDGEIFGYVIPNAQHCYDFRTNFGPGEPSRRFFTDALDRWLKCFKPKKGGRD
ncbi:serine carboxypeptidase S28-domain-containing protein [Dendryphion nanum]|uniref:Serine carboxypeptidase S28-domain-containing protein n=1 Tax=Dendryphion nanum TaxID=256645 RepID=A0A9P9DKV7_9PLEO|nr:serine carboxypeptidase S28-domain-containing protein [Dendryphion nanum]